MMRAKLSTCALLLAVSSALPAATLPGSGMSMQAVESQFGSPLKKNAPVGHPPITRWEYDGFVVVFERSTVINSVNTSRASAPATARTPAPAAAPVKKAAPAAPVAQPASVAKPAPAATPAPVAAPAPATPDSTAQAPAPTSAAAPESAPAQDPISKAAAEKAAEGSAPAPAEAAPANDYTFDPETGRFIIK
jgi:hypothetical protein